MSSPVPEEKELTTAEVTTLKASSSPATPQASPASNEQWLKFGKQTSESIKQVTAYLIDFWEAYQLPLLLVLLFAGVGIFLTIASFLLDAINHIPLVKPLLQLIGLVYMIWFIWRYLVSTSKRQELASELKNWQNFFVSQANSDS